MSGVQKRQERLTNNSKIYDYFYKKFADQVGYKITPTTKAKKVDQILDTMSWDDQQAIRVAVKYARYAQFMIVDQIYDTMSWDDIRAAVKYARYAPYNYDVIYKITGIPKKKLIKSIDIATRHIYNPNNIRLAVPKYYTIKKKNQTKLTEKDFNKYILNRLRESGFETREQLRMHLSNGWYYLWTIPELGDASRQKILIAIDKWNEEEIIHNVDEYSERKRNKNDTSKI